MKEITRIHIAKVAYDIEIGAKKELEQYISALERYAGDKELLADIEIRITELLAERGVKADGVISSDDVTAVRAQLGEPSDFAPDGEEVASELNEEPRRVYRDEEGAVLGGVLAGLGRYFRMDPLWIRLGFVLLLLASFGTATLIYLILWLLIPPAQTAADKLQMNGKPVTLASIKALGERSRPALNGTALLVRRFLRFGLGAAMVLAAIATLGVVVEVARRAFIASDTLTLGNTLGYQNATILDASLWTQAAFGLCAIAGLLLAALFMVLAFAIFRRHWSKKLSMVAGAIIILGLLSFGGGIATSFYAYQSDQDYITHLYKSKSGSTPQNFGNIKKITFDGGFYPYGPVAVNYIVSDKPRYEMYTLPGVELRFELSENGSLANVVITTHRGDEIRPGTYDQSKAYIVIYGPPVDSIQVYGSGPPTTYSNEKGQKQLSVTVSGAKFGLYGTYESVNLNTGGTSPIVQLEGAAIRELNTNVEKGSRITAGVVDSLNIRQAQACATFDGFDTIIRSLELQGIAGGKLTYNGIEKPAKSFSNGCYEVTIGNNDEEQ